MKLKVHVKIQIQKPAEVVFENIINHDRMTCYFVSGSTGRMEEQATLTWTFTDFDEECPVKVLGVIPGSLVEFTWDTGTTVRIELTAQPDQSTIVTVIEEGKEISGENLKWFGGNTEGWANFLACLKAFSEYGINLRKGAFDFYKSSSMEQQSVDK